MGAFVRKICRRSLVRKLSAIFAVIAIYFGIIAPGIVNIVPTAHALVTDVTLSDTDNEGFGLDGRDFTVTWTTDGQEPANYSQTMVFVVESTTADSLTVNNIFGDGCDGNFCAPLVTFDNYTNPLSITMDGRQQDSENNDWTDAQKNYDACVLVLTSDNLNDQLFCSNDDVAYDAVGHDQVQDVEAPAIHHDHQFTAYSNAAPVFSAIVFDEQTAPDTMSQDTVSEVGDEEMLALYFGTDLEAAQTTVEGVQVGGSGNFFTFTLGAQQAQDFEYYIKAIDTAANERYICGDGGVDDATCRQNPLEVEVVSAGSTTLNGSVSGNDGDVSDAQVLISGYALAPETTDINGAFTFDNLEASTFVDAIVFAEGKCQIPGEEIFVDGVNAATISMSNGFCNFDGEGEEARVEFTGPPQRAHGVPVDTDIRIGFNKALNQGSIANGLTVTEIGGDFVDFQSLYCPDNVSEGCDDLPDRDVEGDRSVVLIQPDSDFDPNTNIVVSFTNIQDEDGQFLPPYEFNFVTGGGQFQQQDINDNFGQNGQYMPPFVTGVIPAPGQQAARNADLVVTFNEPMDGDTVDSDSVLLFCDDEAVSGTVTFDTNSLQLVTFTPDANLPASTECELRLLGSIANPSGVTMSRPENVGDPVFKAYFETKATTDSAAPTITPFFADGETGIPVNEGFFEYALSEHPHPDSLSPTTVLMRRGNTELDIKLDYDPGPNSIFVIPENQLLAPNATYSVTFTTGVTDLAGNALAENASFSFTTGAADNTAPDIKEVRCKDFECFIEFTETMKNENDENDFDNYPVSVLNPDNYNISHGEDDFNETTVLDIEDADDGDDLILNYEDRGEIGVVITGFNQPFPVGNLIEVTVASEAEDLSGNSFAADTEFVTKVEPPDRDFNREGMFPRPPQDDNGHGGFHMPGEFGGFTNDDFFNGKANRVEPLTPGAGQSSTYHIEFTPGVALGDAEELFGVDYQMSFDFPRGTDVSNAAQDTFSPFIDDMNEHFGGTMTLVDKDDGGFTDGIKIVDRKVFIYVNITGVAEGEARYMIDLANIVNPEIAKGPDTGGYQLDISLHDSDGNTLVTEESMNYFIFSGGDNTIEVDVQVDTPEAGDDGDVFLFGKGPSGHMGRNITLDDGFTDLVDGIDVVEEAAVFNNLPDGCYHFHTDPFVEINNVDYFGKQHAEPVCVEGGETVEETITLNGSAGNSKEITVSLAGTDGYVDQDVEIFAGCPGGFVSRVIEDIAVNTSETLPLPASGFCFVGVGPVNAKGGSANNSKRNNSDVVFPQPVDVKVDVDGGTIAAGFHGLPPDVTITPETSTIEFTFTDSDDYETVTGSVVDGGDNELADVEVFLHAQGFGAPSFSTTDDEGEFDLNVLGVGSYEIGAFKPGVPPTFHHLEIKPDGNDVGDDPDIYFKGKQITGQNPLELKMLKPDFTISGKVTDENGKTVAYAPIFAKKGNQHVPGETDANGNYNLFVSAGTWSISVEMPPDKTDTCASFSKSVTITTESKANQNIIGSAGTCATLSGTVSIGGQNQANKPVVIEQCDGNDDPVAGGLFRPTITDSAGLYSVTVADSTRYCAAMFDPDSFGELRASTGAVIDGNTTLDLTFADTEEVTFTFTGDDAGDLDAFIEIKDEVDTNKRNGRQFSGLDAEDIDINVTDGDQKYFVHIPGIGEFTGDVPENNEVSIDLSGSDIMTVAGNVVDDDGNPKTGALVTFRDEDGKPTTAITDELGDYSIDIDAGTYTKSVSLAGHIAPIPEEIEVTEDLVDQDFDGEDALGAAEYVIEGNIYEDDGSTPIEDGFVTATEGTSGDVVVAAIDPADGSYSLPVNDGTWTITAGADGGFDKTELETTVTVDGGDEAGHDIDMDVNGQKSSENASKAIANTNGGVINDTSNTGMKITAGGGVFENGSGNVTVSVEKGFKAPETENFVPLGDATFGITATGSSAIKNLNGNIDVQIDYSDIVDELPNGTDEEDLSVAYYSPERGEYVVVEGGFNFDVENNVASFQTNHLTDFVIVSGNSGGGDEGGGNEGGGNQGGGNGGGNGGGSGGGGGHSLGTAVKAASTQSESVEVGDTGVIEKEVALTSKDNEDVLVVLPAGVEVTDADGKPYAGEIEPPKIIDFKSDKKPKDTKQVGLVYEVGLADQGLKFSEPVELRLPLPEGTDPNTRIDVYYYDEVFDTWKLAGDGGTVQKTESGDLVIVVMVNHFTKFAAFQTTDHPFTDMVGHWGEDYVADLYQRKVVKGRTSTTYVPEAEITRAEFTKIAINLFDIDVPNGVEDAGFADVDPGEWYAKYIFVAKEAGIIQGYDGNLFKPNQYIERDEALKILLETAEIDLSTEHDAGFTDVDNTQWYAKYVNYASLHNIVSGYGDGTFGPADNLTRAQAAKIGSQLINSDLVK